MNSNIFTVIKYIIWYQTVILQYWKPVQNVVGLTYQLMRIRNYSSLF